MINLEALHELQELVGEKFPFIIETYLRNGDKYLLEIQASIAKGEQESARCIAHSLRSVSGQIGAVELERLLEQIEESTDDSFMRDPSLWPRLQAAYTAAQIELKKILA